MRFDPSDSDSRAAGRWPGICVRWHLSTGRELLDLTEPGRECVQIEFASDWHLLALMNGEEGYEIVVFGAERTPEAFEK